MRRRSWILTAGLIALSSGCAHRGATADSSEAPASRPTVVNITNHYALQVDVYAVAGGASYRMGTVAPGIDGHFVLRPALLALGPVEIVAHPAGGEPPVLSGRLVLAPGDTVDFEIAANLVNSIARVRE